jgi:hypothetical protein
MYAEHTETKKSKFVINCVFKKYLCGFSIYLFTFFYISQAFFNPFLFNNRVPPFFKKEINKIKKIQDSENGETYFNRKQTNVPLCTIKKSAYFYNI